MPLRSNNPKEAQKRQKVALACEPCRERKIRCDAAKPICGACQRRGGTQEQCLYNLDKVISGPGKEYIRVLQDRIRQLEDSQALRLEQRETAPSRAGEAFLPSATQARLYDDLNDQQTHLAERESLASFTPDDTRSPATVAQQQSSPAVDPGRTGTAGSSLTELRRASIAFLCMPDPATNGTIQSSMSHSTDQNSTPNSTQFTVFTGPSTSGDVEGSINAMGTSSSVSNGNPARRYGKSSAVSFLQQIHRSLEVHPRSKSMTSSICNTGRYAQDQQLSLAGRSPDLYLEDFTLPCRRLGDHLLQCYWDHVYTLYPFVHRPSFLAAYNKIWSGELLEMTPSDGLNIGLGGSNCCAALFYCALNAIFALGCHFSDVPSEERDTLSASFFRRSANLMNMNIIDNGDIALLQTLLIITQFLQSTQMPTRCWNTLGVAVRVAQGLGLYRDDSNSTKRSSLETEMRRRTWHGCIMLDLILSMTLGRPSMTYGKTVAPQPLAIDDEYLSKTSTSCSQPDNYFSNITFFIQSIKLFSILGDILLKVYKPWNEAAPPDRSNEEKIEETSTETIIALDCALSDFEQRVPPQLRWNSKRLSRSVEDRATMQQRNVLHARYLHLRIVLYRPIFNNLCRKDRLSARTKTSKSGLAGPELGDRADNLLLTSLAIQCSTACIDAACELIELISSTSHTNVTGAWWYNIFYLYTSAMVLLLAELSTSVRDPSNQSSKEFSWQQCLDTLDRISTRHTEAKQCATTLGLLRKQVSAIIERVPEISNASKVVYQSPSSFETFESHETSRNVDTADPSQPAAFSYEGAPNLNFDFDADNIQLNQMLNLNSGMFQCWNVEDMSSWGVPMLDH